MASFRVRPFKEVYSEFDVTEARRIGAGGFGKVYLVLDKRHKRKHAAKYQKLTSSKLKDIVRNEAKFLKELGEGKRIVNYIDYFEKDQHSLLVIEYLGAGDLFSKISSTTYTLTEEKCKNFVIEICKALDYIHERNVIHLDLKPANIMMKNKTDQYKLKLIDFGLAKRLDSKGFTKVGFCGTVGFMAPEIARCQYPSKSDPPDNASRASDMFSLGVIVYMLVSGGSEPFWKGSDVQAIKNTIRKDVDFPSTDFRKVSETAKQFIRDLLHKKPRNRLTASQALDSKWLRTDEMDGGRESRYSRVDTLNMRSYQARKRWYKAIRAVTMMIKVNDAFVLPSLY